VVLGPVRLGCWHLVQVWNLQTFENLENSLSPVEIVVYWVYVSAGYRKKKLLPGLPYQC
jgi:hypothetical protein